MNIVFWLSMLGMLLVAIGILVLPSIRVNPLSSIAYKESNLSLYNSKVQELELDLDEGRIDKEHYMSAVSELDHELLLDVPVEGKESADLSYGATAKPRPRCSYCGHYIFAGTRATDLYADGYAY